MDKRIKRKFSSEFKVKLVLEALKERNTIEELAKRYEVHPNQIGNWKKEFLSKATNIFNRDGETIQNQKQKDDLVEKLYTQIGKQKVEIEWMKKKLD